MTNSLNNSHTTNLSNSFIDLHTHSTASDGTMSPDALIRHAVEAGLQTVSLTDHDTVSGIASAYSTAEELGIEFIPGVEISADTPLGSMHILGYLIDYESVYLTQALDWMQTQRNKRNDDLLDKLSSLGIKLDADRLKQIANDELVTRPHFAQLMIEMGVVRDYREAFKKYLGNEGKAFIPKVRMQPVEALGAIREAGGLPVLAHPVELIRYGANLEQILEELSKIGLEGIEVWYSNHLSEESEYFLSLASHFNLVATGGSDFHGSCKPDIAIGRGYGNLKVSHKVVDNLIRRRDLILEKL